MPQQLPLFPGFVCNPHYPHDASGPRTAFYRNRITQFLLVHGRTATVRRNGRGVVCCIVHNDANPSLDCNFETGWMKCYGCGECGYIWWWELRFPHVCTASTIDALGREQ